MIQFKKRGGRYQPFKNGKNLDMSVHHRESKITSGVYARGSTNSHDASKEDELYEEMREGTPDEEIDSQEVTSVRDLPKEVLAEM